MTAIFLAIAAAAEESDLIVIRLFAVLLAIFGAIALMRVGLDKVKETLTHADAVTRWIGVIAGPVFVWSFWRTTSKLLAITNTYSPLVESVRVGLIFLAALYLMAAIKLIIQKSRNAPL